MAKVFTAFVFGLIFGVGILISGMANPAKVLNFFDVAGTWDPSLMFVMGGALIVTAIGYRFVFRLPHPLLDGKFLVPTRKDLDLKLILGSVIFGVGWGMSGFCPGGLIPAIGIGIVEPIIAVAAVLAGMYTYKTLTRTQA
ncbi:MAG: YeeE/YedE family protein [Rhodobacteraceae bacterium]|nr:YeeE/YedE family protein [Paracoccaceae bacterium]